MNPHLDYIFDFLSDLKRNNTRAWMHARATEKRYDVVRRTWTRFVALLAIDMSDLEDTRGLKPKDFSFRIWRDTRFSKDKTPCKTYISAVIKKGGRNNPNRAAYYFHLQPGGESFVGGGVWMPESEQLSRIRKGISHDGGGLAKILKHPKFKKTFGDLELQRLKTMPRDYKKANVSAAARALLPYTSFVVTRPLTDAFVQSSRIERDLVDYFTILKPFNDWLNRALSEHY